MKDITIRLNTIIAALRIISQEVNGIHIELYGEETPTAPEPQTPQEPEELQQAAPAPKPKQQPPKEEKKLFGFGKKELFECFSENCRWAVNGVCKHPKALATCDARVIQ